MLEMSAPQETNPSGPPEITNPGWHSVRNTRVGGRSNASFKQLKTNTAGPR